jgi:predicted ATPase/DNA-binding SARP family transcriptional activator
LFCRVLGPVEVEIEGALVDLGGPTPRRLVAAMLSAEGASVSDAVLAQLTWDGSPPGDGFDSLRVLVSRLRSVLGPVGRGLVQRVGSGYRLAVAAESTDHGRFVRLVDDGARLLGDGAAAEAARAFESALLLWRGQPWVELGDALPAEGARVRLLEQREVAVEELQAARLELGDTAAAVAALSEAVIEKPYRERRWELLALGLYRAGRQGHALAELRRVRQLLGDELGTEPGLALREIERRMLSHDPTLLPAVPVVVPPGAPAATPPRPAEVRPWSSLVGRAAPLRALDELTSTQRLVTVVGPAGVGKTRLSLEHAATAGAAHGEVWVARLAEVHAAPDVAAVVATSVGVVHVAGDLVALIRHALLDRPGLLLLDNCEHLLEPVAALTRRLLADCPDLRILATSRAPLCVAGEHPLALEPLPVLDEHGGDGAAVELLFDRVRANRAGWRPSEAERRVGREICTMLDGLPLAIELASARERAFGLTSIATHLAERVDVLAATPRGSVNPHASLDAAISWSVGQLRPADRALLLRLWPFEGGFSWQAAEAVQPPEVDDAVLAVLGSLVDRSVISIDTLARPARYRMLETIRRHCRDADPDPAASEQAHASWVRELVAEQTPELTGPRAGQAYQLLAAELANIRAGIGNDLRHQPTAALRTCAVLEWVWVSLGVLPEGMRLLRAALDASPGAPAEDRARGLLALSIGSFHSGDPAVTLRLADEALRLREGITDRDLLLNALSRRALAAIELHDPELARAALTQFLREAGGGPASAWQTPVAQLAEAVLHLMDGTPEQGEAAFDAARRHSRECGFLWGEGTADLILAWHLLGGSGARPARPREALRSLNRALRAFQEQTNKSDVLGVLYAGAHALSMLDGPATGGQLRAAVLEHSGRIGVNPRRYTHLTGAGASPGPATLAAEHAGRAMSWTAMVELFVSASARVLDTPDGIRDSP